MIAKIVRGKAFRGVLQYTLAPAHQPAVVGGNMAGENPRDLAREFALVRQLRPGVEKPVHHVAIALHPGERRLSDAGISRLAEDYLRAMGWDLERSQYVIVRHNDTPHQHVHVVANRIRLDGSLQPMALRDYRQSKKVCREIERTHDLRPMRERPRDQILERPPTRGEYSMRRERGVLSQKEQLTRMIREAAHEGPTMTEFVERLRRQGVAVRPNIATTGHVSGLSYSFQGFVVRGSQLGRAYTWRGVQQAQGVRYDPERDLPALRRADRESRDPKLRRQPTPELPAQLGRVAARALLGQIPGALERVAALRAALRVTGAVLGARPGQAAALVLPTATAVLKTIQAVIPKDPSPAPPLEIELNIPARPPEEPGYDPER